MTDDATVEAAPQDTCPFCAIVRGESPARLVLDTNEVLVFFPREPAVVGHVLVVPKRHIANVWDLDSATGALLTDATLRVAHGLHAALRPDGLNVIQSNGEAATQTVQHLHIHLVPRWYDDPIGDFWPAVSPWTEAELDRAQQRITEKL